MSSEWIATDEQLPPEGVEVEVLNGNVVQSLVLKNGLWWVPDFSMYVYFVPRCWRLSQSKEAKG